MRVYTNNYTKVFLIDPITASIERAGLFRWDWCLVGYDWNKDIDASPVINIIPFNDIDSVTFDTKDVR